MHSKLLIYSLVVLTAATMSLTGCTPKPPVKKGAGAGPTGDNPEGLSPLGKGDGISSENGGVGARGLAVNGNYTKGEFEPVYFDFDSAKVRPGELAKLEKVATRVRQGGGLIVEGYADERGTAEYNRALGEKRALACREELVKLGVPASSISTASYGEDHPKAMGHDEAAWSQNRRCEFGIAK